MVLKSTKRAEIHLFGYRYSPRHPLYLFRGSKKSLWLALGGSAAAHAGATFTRLPNEVVVARGAQGEIPPRLIASAFLPKPYGPTRIESSALKNDPPRIVTNYNAPDIGPPGPFVEMAPVMLDESHTEHQEKRRRTP